MIIEINVTDMVSWVFFFVFDICSNAIMKTPLVKLILIYYEQERFIRTLSVHIILINLE